MKSLAELELKVGDRVRNADGLTGTVIEVRDFGAGECVCVVLDWRTQPEWYTPSALLELLPRAASVPGPWSAVKPVDPGYWWWRENEVAGTVYNRIVVVYRSGPVLMVDAGRDFGPLDLWAGEWGGRIADAPPD